jgi:hypothetical protein
MFRRELGVWLLTPLLSMTLAGCASPFYTDRGALVGGVGGAGVGAAVGEAVGHPGVGALVGAGVGTVTGAAIGNSMDQQQARNQAMIASQMGRPIPPGAVTINDVLAMSRSQLDEDVIVNHIRSNGVAQPLAAGDLIVLTQQGVSKRIIEAMQASPPYPGGPNVVRVPGPPGPPAVLVDQRYIGPPYPYPYPYPYPPPPPAYGFGFSYGVGRR